MSLASELVLDIGKVVAGHIAPEAEAGARAAAEDAARAAEQKAAREAAEAAGDIKPEVTPNATAPNADVRTATVGKSEKKPTWFTNAKQGMDEFAEHHGFVGRAARWLTFGKGGWLLMAYSAWEFGGKTISNLFASGTHYAEDGVDLAHVVDDFRSGNFDKLQDDLSNLAASEGIWQSLTKYFGLSAGFVKLLETILSLFGFDVDHMFGGNPTLPQLSAEGQVKLAGAKQWLAHNNYISAAEAQKGGELNADTIKGYKSFLHENHLYEGDITKSGANPTFIMAMEKASKIYPEIVPLELVGKLDEQLHTQFSNVFKGSFGAELDGKAPPTAQEFVSDTMHKLREEQAHLPKGAHRMTAHDMQIAEQNLRQTAPTAVEALRAAQTMQVQTTAGLLRTAGEYNGEISAATTFADIAPALASYQAKHKDDLQTENGKVGEKTLLSLLMATPETRNFLDKNMNALAGNGLLMNFAAGHVRQELIQTVNNASSVYRANPHPVAPSPAEDAHGAAAGHAGPPPAPLARPGLIARITKSVAGPASGIASTIAGYVFSEKGLFDVTRVVLGLGAGALVVGTGGLGLIPILFAAGAAGVAGTAVSGLQYGIEKARGDKDAGENLAVNSLTSFVPEGAAEAGIARFLLKAVGRDVGKGGLIRAGAGAVGRTGIGLASNSVAVVAVDALTGEVTPDATPAQPHAPDILMLAK